MKTVYIFRHGETDWNREWRLQGHTDIPLNERGREQAKALGGFFEQHPVDVFLSSDLERARKTAEIASGGKQIPIVIDKRVRETNLGECEGLTHDEINLTYGADVWQTWAQVGPNMWEARLPGGESKREHLTRVLDGLNDFLSKTEYERVGVATHGGTIRRLVHHFAPELKDPAMIGNCAVYRFEYSKKKGLTLPLHAPLWTCMLT